MMNEYSDDIDKFMWRKKRKKWF